MTNGLEERSSSPFSGCCPSPSFPSTMLRRLRGNGALRTMLRRLRGNDISRFRQRAPRSRIGDIGNVKKPAAWHCASPDRPDGAGFAPRSRIGDIRSVRKPAAGRGMSTNRLRGAKVAPGSRFLGRNVADPAAWHGICATQPDRCHGAPRSRFSDSGGVDNSALWRKSSSRRPHPFRPAPRSRISDTKHVDESAAWRKPHARRAGERLGGDGGFRQVRRFVA